MSHLWSELVHKQLIVKHFISLWLIVILIIVSLSILVWVSRHLTLFEKLKNFFFLSKLMNGFSISTWISWFCLENITRSSSKILGQVSFDIINEVHQNYGPMIMWTSKGYGM